MNITIVVPFPNAETGVWRWASEETQIDWFQETERAARCTCAFAALELRRYLLRTLCTPVITVSSVEPNTGLTISLNILKPNCGAGQFSIEPESSGVRITGNDRTGLLYGVYEFLHLQGWRWYSPGKDGEIAPSVRDRLNIPQQGIKLTPAFPLGRGFHMTYVSMESEDMWLWMVRNRLNVCGFRPATGPLGHRLGMTFKNGGHIFEEILNPDRVIADGFATDGVDARHTVRQELTLWNQHRDWYGLPLGKDRTKGSALKTQFCVSRPDLLQFLSEEVLERLAGEWNQVHHLDIWGFDTWGDICACEGCRRLGNGSDQMLSFLSFLREYIDQALLQGRLDHDVALVMCAYEGTGTLMGPQNPIPANLHERGDYVTFYPINRCYAHDFTDPSCEMNARYAEALRSWLRVPRPLPMVLGEYYNVSKFEDLPLLFPHRIGSDIAAFHDMGVKGVTYMHSPMVAWGMRTLNQHLFARCSSEPGCDTREMETEYFPHWYGPVAEQMENVYRWVEDAWKYVSDWRSWSHESVLSKLLGWEGSTPAVPFTMENHLGTVDTAIEEGSKSIALMRKSLIQIEQLRTGLRDRLDCAEDSGGSTRRQIEYRLSEDRRQIIYGLDTMLLTTELLTYYRALQHGDAAAADAAWQRTENAAEKLDSYYVPLDYEWPGAGLVVKDALTRTQLREVVDRCRLHRSRRAGEARR